MQRWIVVSNCQAFGLANSIQCLARNVDCIPCDIWEYKRAVAEDPGHYRQYDMVVTSPEIMGLDFHDPSHFARTMVVPAFQFGVYHPDCVNVFVDGAQKTNGWVGPYHSFISLAAYKEGLDAERAARFFRRGVFEAGQYFDQWSAQRDWQIGQFRAHGIDIAPIFARRSRGRAFMHTVNHPKIEILFDIARIVLETAGEPVFADVGPPPDNLDYVGWPIYPEIGEALGVAGAFLFKPLSGHKPLSLVDFLAHELAVFGAWDRAELSVDRGLRSSIQRIRSMMREAA